MEFLDITLLGMTYRYAAKIEQKFKQKKQDFGSANPKPRKGAHEPQNKGQSQNKVTQKWCEFHNNTTHNTIECRAKQSLVAKLKAPESDACSDPKPEPNKGDEKGKQIIDVDPSAIVATTKI